MRATAADPHYTPSTTRREAHRLDTHAWRVAPVLLLVAASGLTRANELTHDHRLDLPTRPGGGGRQNQIHVVAHAALFRARAAQLQPGPAPSGDAGGLVVAVFALLARERSGSSGKPYRGYWPASSRMTARAGASRCWSCDWSPSVDRAAARQPASARIHDLLPGSQEDKRRAGACPLREDHPDQVSRFPRSAPSATPP